MKKILLSGLFAVLAATAAAQQTATLTAGSGDNSISVLVASDGHISGDTATYDPVGAGAAATTIYKNYFSVVDVTNNQIYYSDRISGGNKPTEGTVSSGGFALSNTGIGFANSPGLTGNLGITVSQPTATTARITWAWVFLNSTASPISLKQVWFLDADNNIAPGDYSNDLVAFTKTVSGYTPANSFGQIAIGNPSGSAVDLLTSGLMDSSVAPEAFYGVSYNTGSSFYWSAQNDFAANGVRASGGLINAALVNKVQGDADSNYLTDAGADAGAAMQVPLTVPANGSVQVNYTLTYGINDTVGGGEFSVASVNNWMNY